LFHKKSLSKEETLKIIENGFNKCNRRDISAIALFEYYQKYNMINP
jgi:hypothetical protein